MVRMSLREGGDAEPDEVEAGGIRARLEGRDEAMTESPSPSSRTDDGRGDDSLASLESGLGVIGVGDCLRSCAFGILPTGSLASRQRSMGQIPGVSNGISCRRNRPDLLPLHSSRSSMTAGAPPEKCRLLGCSEWQGRLRRSASQVARCALQATWLPSSASTYRSRTSQLSRLVSGKLQNGSGAYPGVFGQGPVAVSSGIVCQAVDVTQRPLRMTDCATQGHQRDSIEGSRS